MNSTDFPRPQAKANEPSTDEPHDEPRKKRGERTFAEAVQQGEVIKNALQQESENILQIISLLSNRTIKRVYILGCGDSWFVGVGVRLAFERLLAIPTEAMQALDFGLYYHEIADPQTLVIGISSSGTTPTVLQAMQKAHERGAFTIGVTNTKGSKMDQDFSASIFVPATRKGWPTQASTAAMALLINFALELSAAAGIKTPQELAQHRQDLENLPDVIQAVIDLSLHPMEQLARQLVSARYFLLCGGGPHYAAACFGGAKIKELCPIHAMTIPLEEFHHYRSLKPGDPLFLVAPDAPSHRRALDTAEVGRYDGGKIFAIVPEGEEEISNVAHWVLKLPHVNPLLAPIVYSVPLHFFAYYLAMAKFQKGLGYPRAFLDDRDS